MRKKVPENLEVSVNACYICSAKQKLLCKMTVVLNEYHKTVNAEMRRKVVYWKEHPLSRSESLRRLKHLREQRLANLSNW